MALVFDEKFGTVPSTGVPITWLTGAGNHTSPAINDSTNFNGSSAIVNNTSGTYITNGGTVMSFNGTSDYLSTPAPTGSGLDFGTGNFTVECYFYANTTADQSIWSIGDNTVNDGNNIAVGAQYFGTALSGKIRAFLYVGLTQYYVDSSSAVATNTWHHVAVVRNGGSFKLYIDGNDQGYALIYSNAANTSATYSLYLGRYASNDTRYLNGYIDEFRVTLAARYTSSTYTVPTGVLKQYPPLSSITDGDPFYNKTILSYHFDNYITDTSPAANNSVIQFGNPQIVSGAYKFGGKSLYMDGNSYLRVTVPGGLGDNFTIDYWVYLTAASGYIFNSRSSGTGADGIDIRYDGYTTTAGAGVCSASTIPTGAWTHCALVRNNSNFTFYVNGVAGGTGTNNYSFTNTTFTIGGSPYGNVGYISGYIDDFRISKCVRYTGAFTPPTVQNSDYMPTVSSFYDGLYPLVELMLHADGANNSTTFTDSSFSARTITRNGTPIISNAVGNTLLTDDSSIQFDGTGYITVLPRLADTQFYASPYTIEVWVYFDNLTTCGVFTNKLTSNTAGMLIFQTGGALKYYSSSSGAANVWDLSNGVAGVQFGTVSTNQWYHVAMSRLGNNIYLFLNGVLGATIKSDVPQFTPGSTFILGNWWTTSNNLLNGKIKHFIVTKDCAKYTSSFTPVLPTFTYDAGDPNYLATQLLLKVENTDIVDYSPYSTRFTTTGNVTVSSAQYRFNKSIYFDGSSYITTTDTLNIGTKDYTIEAWVLVPAGGFINYECVIDTRAGGVGAALYVGNGLQLSIADNSTIYSGSTLTSDAWNHIALQRSGGITRGILNGTQVVSYADTRTYSSGVVYIGASSIAAQKITGYIEEPRITVGVGRYTYEAVPTVTAPIDMDDIEDPYFSNVKLLMNFDGTTFKDLSINEKVISAPTGAPAVISTAAKKFGRSSAYFNGTGYLKTDPSTDFNIGSGDFTIEAWVNPSSFENGDHVIALTDDVGNNELRLYLDSDRKAHMILYHTGAYQMTLNGSTVMNSGTWYHLAIVRYGNLHSLLVNGIVEASYTMSHTWPYSNPIAIIGHLGTLAGDNYKFNGYIDDVRVTVGVARYKTDPDLATTKLLLMGNVPNANSSLLRDTNQSVNGYTSSISPNLSIVSNSRNKLSTTYYNGSTVTLFTHPNGIAFSGDFTIEFMMNTTNTTVGQVILSSNVNDFAYSGWSWNVNLVTGGYVVLQIYNGAGLAATIGGVSGSVWDGLWHHVAFTRSSGSCKLYVDGVLTGATATNTDNMGINSATTTRSAIRIGAKLSNADGVTCSNYYTGYIDNIRIANVAPTGTPTPYVAPQSVSLLTAHPVRSYHHVDRYWGNTSLLMNFDTAIVDYSINTKTITSVGSPTISSTQSKFGGSSLYLNGSSYLTVPQSPNFDFYTDDFTIECWVYFSSVTGITTIMRYGDITNGADTSTSFTLYNSSGTLNASIHSGSSFGSLTTAALMVANTWYHVAAVRNSGMFYLYLDGVQVGKQYFASSLNTTTRTLMIGYWINGTPRYHTGYIDDVRITRGAARYISNFTPPAMGLPTYGETHGGDYEILTGKKYASLQYQTSRIGSVYQRRHSGAVVFTRTAQDYGIVEFNQPLRTSGEMEFELELNSKITGVYAGIHLLAGQARVSNGVMFQFWNSAGTTGNSVGYGYVWNDATTAWTTATAVGPNLAAANWPFSNVGQDRKTLGVRWDYSATTPNKNVEILVDGVVVWSHYITNMVSLFGSGLKPAISLYGNNTKVFGVKVWDTPRTSLSTLSGRTLAQIAEANNGNLDTSYTDTAAVRTHRSFGFTYSRPSVVPKFGLGKISGTVKEKGIVNTPVKRRVVLMQDEAKVAETWSDATTGYYEFLYLDPSTQFTLLSYDHTGNFRAVIADRIYPISTPPVLL